MQNDSISTFLALIPKKRSPTIKPQITNNAFHGLKKQLAKASSNQYEISEDSDTECREMAKEFTMIQNKIVKDNPVPHKKTLNGDVVIPEKK